MPIINTKLTTLAIVVSAILSGIAGCNDSSNSVDTNTDTPDPLEAQAALFPLRVGR